MQSKKYLLEAAHEIKAKVSFSSFVDVVFCCTKFSCLEFLCQIVERRTHPLRKAIPFVSEPTIVFGADISHCILGEGYISIASVCLNISVNMLLSGLVMEWSSKTCTCVQ
jgi:hypothetical protein